jgi:hypothetical protein
VIGCCVACSVERSLTSVAARHRDCWCGLSAGAFLRLLLLLSMRSLLCLLVGALLLLLLLGMRLLLCLAPWRAHASAAGHAIACCACFRRALMLLLLACDCCSRSASVATPHRLLLLLGIALVLLLA